MPKVWPSVETVLPLSAKEWTEIHPVPAVFIHCNIYTTVKRCMLLHTNKDNVACTEEVTNLSLLGVPISVTFKDDPCEGTKIR